MGEKKGVGYKALLLRLLRELEQVEAMAYLLADALLGEGLVDEAGMMQDLSAVARDWADEVCSWLEKLLREKGGKEGAA